VKLNVPIKDVKCSTAQNVSLSANNLIALLTAKPPNQNVNQYVKNLNVIGNATNLLVLNLNVNLFVKIPTVSQRLNAVLVL
jgi:hypothetical protein